MKAICINNNWTDKQDIPDDTPSPDMLEDVEITGIFTNPRGVEGIYYQLKGYPQTTAFDSANFAPVSDREEVDIKHARDTKRQTQRLATILFFTALGGFVGYALAKKMN